MKAAQIRNYGDPSVVSIINDAPKPIAGEGQVLVEVHSSSINPVDTALRSGYLQQIAPLQLPVTLGTDISGVVAELGSGVDELSVGDKIYGSAIVLARGSGAFAEYALLALVRLLNFRRDWTLIRPQPCP
ncbi:MAG TPA: alcohol dehydrogenase catalytic domain-containing protein [Bacteroidota bacterium]|nr:alcohol dehydrogenase catalytic domain-containing protein [Bacteroidota bacterium]